MTRVHELSPRQLHRLIPLFSRRPAHQVAVSACQGLVPCRAFADDPQQPSAAVLSLRRFGIAFAAGDLAHAHALLEALRGWHPWYEINDPPAAWHPALADWSRKSYATPRYAFDNDPAAFDLAALRAYATPAPGCEILPYDAPLLAQALAADWSEDQLGAFATPDDFLRHGIGMALVRDGELLAGCASFCRHADGYEIQVDTHPQARGKGYATAVSAAFLLRALQAGKKPCWDAANAVSLRLAQKLGFVFRQVYVSWMLIAPGTSAQAAADKAIGPDLSDG